MQTLTEIHTRLSAFDETSMLDKLRSELRENYTGGVFIQWYTSVDLQKRKKKLEVGSPFPVAFTSLIIF